MNNKQCPEMNKWISVEVKYLDHDKIVLTRKKGDTYTSKSEELMDFFHDEDTVEPNEMTEELEKQFGKIVLGEEETFIDRIAQQHTNSKLEELEKWVQENKTTFIDGYETVPVKILKEKITSKKK